MSRSAGAELHPYKVPELLALPVESGLERYLRWIDVETARGVADEADRDGPAA